MKSEKRKVKSTKNGISARYKSSVIGKASTAGITLIALVITIIVLLILAGITINLTIGQDGIITKADEAGELTRITSIEEKIELAVLGALVNNEPGEIKSTSILKNELDNIFGENQYKITEVGEEWIVEVEDYEATIQKNGTIIKPRDTKTLVGNEGTTPWLPKGFSQVAGTDLSTGLVISNTTDGKPGTQNYVWIEVPTTIQGMAEAKTNEEIEAVLKTYVGQGTSQDYTKGSSSQTYGWKDEWYDNFSTTWDGESEYTLISYRNTYQFGKWKDYYGESNVYYSTSSDANGSLQKVNFDTDTYLDGNYYFVKAKGNSVFQNNSDACGLTYNEYQTIYSKMLQNIKKYGGFWIAQYEAGIAYEKDGETPTCRTSHSEISIMKANYARDQYPYNYLNVAEAQKIASADSTREYTSSLLFGIQWDLVCKFLEVKTDLTYYDIATNSKWGNFTNTIWTSSSTSRYSTDGTSFISEAKEKTTEESILLTTGAIEVAKSLGDSNECITNPMNIYDFGGNVMEWTLEHAILDPEDKMSARGGFYWYSGEKCPVAYRTIAYGTRGGYYGYRQEGFRSTLY